MVKLESCLILLVMATLVITGCYAELTIESSEADVTTLTPEQSDVVLNATYTADQNTTALNMTVNETVQISLNENPTTGYMWNVTTSSGLEILADEYTPDAVSQMMAGAGGIHEWILKAVDFGNQTFSAVNMRSFENLTGSEESYTLNITVQELI